MPAVVQTELLRHRLLLGGCKHMEGDTHCLTRQGANRIFIRICKGDMSLCANKPSDLTVNRASSDMMGNADVNSVIHRCLHGLEVCSSTATKKVNTILLSWVFWELLPQTLQRFPQRQAPPRAARWRGRLWHNPGQLTDQDRTHVSTLPG